ncbi:hypothetical protein [Agrobacterium pusense]|nr:hypothetical protein [Agrobacterium pusense]
MANSNWARWRIQSSRYVTSSMLDTFDDWAHTTEQKRYPFA